MCDEVIGDCLAALKLIPDWLVTSKMLEKLDNALHANDDMLFYNEDFDKVTFIANQTNNFAVDLDKINLDNDNNFYENNPDTIIHVRLLLSKELIPIVWHLKDGGIFACQKMRKK